MCGIAGMLTLEGGPPPSRPLLARMNEAIRHRGPDEGGLRIDGPAGLGMRRLSILDLAGGSQPIGNEDGTIWITYNGEVYNFDALRRELESSGHTFRTRTDTETIVHGYEVWGDAVLDRLRGMFAFALWDAPRRRLLLARDRAGIKPLFWTAAGGRLLWGSEIKALLQDDGVPRELDPEGLNAFLAYGFVPGERTMFRGVRELPPGHLLVVEDGRISVRRWWRLRYAPDRRRTLDETVEAFREVLESAVRMRMIADVPLGAFLSGGVDSGSVVALMARHSDEPVRTFSMGYDEGGDAFDERAAAAIVAERYGTHHREKVVAPDLAGIADRLVAAFDQPFEDASALPNWYLAEMTREHVTVALSGLGGDEVLAGYERYRGALLAERFSWIPRFARRLATAAVDRVPDASSGWQWIDRAKRFLRSSGLPFDERYWALVRRLERDGRVALMHPDVRAAIDPEEPASTFRGVLGEVADADPLNRALYADLNFYLAGDLLTLADRTSMAHSLEVRVPFVDHEVLEFCATVPPEWKLRGMEKKFLLRRAARDWLPREILDRRKMGFSVPLAPWFRGPLRDWLHDTLSERALRDFGAFDPVAVRGLMEEHESRRANRAGVLWSIATCLIWDRTVRRATPLREIAE